MPTKSSTLNQINVKTKKKTPIKTLKNKLWTLTSKIVRLQSETCYTCDKWLNFESRSAGHFWTKGSHSSVKYDLDNLRVQCVSCNSFKSGNIAEYSVRLLKEIGRKRFNALDLRAHTPKKYTREELESLIEERKKCLQRISDDI